MEIYIPTLGRPTSDTLLSLPPELSPIIVVDFREREKFLRWHPNKFKITPEHIRGIGPTRQWIIEQAKSDKVVMLDDDLVFATRRDDDTTKFRTSTTEDVIHLFNCINIYLDSTAHVGVSTREGGNRDTSHSVRNTRLLRILAYRVDVLHREKIRFDRLEFMEDFDVTLQLLERGYPNLKLNWIVHNQRSSNAPGGCSTYRTIEGQAEAARGLRGLHPEFVSVVTKKTKTAWNGLERQDVRIQWRKAFDSAGKTSLLDSGAQPGDAEEGPGTTETLE